MPSFPFEGLLGKQAFKFMPAKNLNKEENRVPLTGDEALVEPENFPKRRCSSGFFLDDRNRCKRIAFKAKREKRRRSQPKVFTFPQEK